MRLKICRTRANSAHGAVFALEEQQRLPFTCLNLRDEPGDHDMVAPWMRLAQLAPDPDHRALDPGRPAPFGPANPVPFLRMRVLGAEASGDVGLAAGEDVDAESSRVVHRHERAGTEIEGGEHQWRLE